MKQIGIARIRDKEDYVRCKQSVYEDTDGNRFILRRFPCFGFHKIPEGYTIDFIKVTSM